MDIFFPNPEDGRTSCKVWLTFIQRRRCSNKAKAQNPLKFAGVPQNLPINLSHYWMEVHRIVRTSRGDIAV